MTSEEDRTQQDIGYETYTIYQYRSTDDTYELKSESMSSQSEI